MKNKLLLIIVMITFSCSNDDESIVIPRETFTKEIIFCSQDYVIQIDDQWIPSADYETNEPLNPILSAYFLDGNLELESETYELSKVILRVAEHDVVINGNRATITIPDLELYIINTDFFFLEVDFYKN